MECSRTRHTINQLNNIWDVVVIVWMSSPSISRYGPMPELHELYYTDADDDDEEIC